MYRISIRSLALSISTLLILTATIGHAAPKVAFITSEVGTGVMSTWTSSGGMAGLDGADQVCRTLAANAGLANPNDFVAWLSDSSDDAYCRLHGLSGRILDPMPCGQLTLPTSAGPWSRSDGTPIVPSGRWSRPSTRSAVGG